MFNKTINYNVFGTILFCSRNNFHFRFTLDVNMEKKLGEIQTLYDQNIVLRKEQEKALLYLTEQGVMYKLIYQ